MRELLDPERLNGKQNTGKVDTFQPGSKSNERRTGARVMAHILSKPPVAR